MGVYQRDGRFMVYWNENGKRHDKSFGRGDDARLRAEAFDLAIMQAKEKGRPALEVEMVTVGVPGVVQSADFGEIGHPIRNIRPPLRG